MSHYAFYLATQDALASLKARHEAIVALYASNRNGIENSPERIQWLADGDDVVKLMVDYGSSPHDEEKARKQVREIFNGYVLDAAKPYDRVMSLVYVSGLTPAQLLTYIDSLEAPAVSILLAKSSIGEYKLPFSPRRMKNFDLFATQFRQYILD
jgi:hypothetical protein